MVASLATVMSIIQPRTLLQNATVSIVAWCADPNARFYEIVYRASMQHSTEFDNINILLFSRIECNLRIPPELDYQYSKHVTILIQC